MNPIFSGIMKLSAQALSECYHVFDDDLPPAPAVSLAPGATDFKSVDVGDAGAVCVIDLKIDEGGTVDFSVFRRNEYESYKAGRRELLLPVASCKETAGFDGAQILLDAGGYLLSVQNRDSTTVTVKLNFRLRKR